MLGVIYCYAVSMRNARSLAGCFGSRRRECSGQEMTIYARRVCGRHFADHFPGDTRGRVGRWRRGCFHPADARRTSAARGVFGCMLWAQILATVLLLLWASAVLAPLRKDGSARRGSGCGAGLHAWRPSIRNRPEGDASDDVPRDQSNHRSLLVVSELLDKAASRHVLEPPQTFRRVTVDGGDHTRFSESEIVAGGRARDVCWRHYRGLSRPLSGTQVISACSGSSTATR